MTNSNLTVIFFIGTMCKIRSLHIEFATLIHLLLNRAEYRRLKIVSEKLTKMYKDTRNCQGPRVDP